MIKERISERLAALGLSPRAASLQAGLSADAIRNIMREGSKSPRSVTVSKIAAVLQCQPGYLTGETDELISNGEASAEPVHKLLKDTAAKAIRFAYERRGVPISEAELAEIQVEYMRGLSPDPGESSTPPQTQPHPRKPK